MAETFSDRYPFVICPSIRQSPRCSMKEKVEKSCAFNYRTVLNQNKNFYQNCIKAFADSGYDIMISIGEKTEIASLGHIPDSFTVENYLD